jgi:hypothetical protein
LIELVDLKGRNKIKDYDILTLLKYWEKEVSELYG